MSTTYHLNKKGVFAPCDAKEKVCPLGAENHLVLDSNIKTLDDFWTAFKTAKEGKSKTTTVSVESLDDSALEEVTGSILSDPQLTKDERKAKATQLFVDSGHNNVVLYEMVTSKMYTDEEVDALFFDSPEEAKQELLSTVFSPNEAKRDDETLLKYAPYANQLVNSVDKKGKERKNEPYYFQGIFGAVARNAQNDNVIAAYLPVIQTLELYMKRYSEPKISEFLDNPNISKSTATAVLGTIVRSGQQSEFYDGAVSIRARLDGVKSDNDYRDKIHEELSSMPHEGYFAGEPEPQIVKSAEKTFAEEERQRRGHGFSMYEYAANSGVLSVYDSYESNHNKLVNRLAELKQLKKKEKDHNARFRYDMEAMAIETRQREAKKYRQRVNYYWELVTRMTNSQNW